MLIHRNTRRKNVLPRLGNVNKIFSSLTYRFIVTCFPRPIMDRKKVCKHTLFKKTFEKFFEAKQSKRATRDGKELWLKIATLPDFRHSMRFFRMTTKNRNGAP